MESEILDIYREKYVAFIDILGFTRLVEEADQSVDRRRELLQIVHLLRDSLCENPRIGMSLTQFSDCMVLSANRTTPGLCEMLDSIDAVTLNLLQYDVFVRGGLSLGGAHHDRAFVYGLGVNKAYWLEKCRAKQPRIVVDERVVAEITTIGLAGRLQRDADGLPFVHYLRAFAEYDPAPLPGKAILDHSAALVINHIVKRLGANDVTDSVLKKAQWFRNYWNRTVAPRGQFGAIEAGAAELPRATRSIVARRLNSDS